MQKIMKGGVTQRGDENVSQRRTPAGDAPQRRESDKPGKSFMQRLRVSGVDFSDFARPLLSQDAHIRFL